MKMNLMEVWCSYGGNKLRDLDGNKSHMCESNIVSQNSDYNRSLTPVGTFDVFVSTAAIFLVSKTVHI